MNSAKMAQFILKKQKLRFAVAITLLTLCGFIGTTFISYFVARGAVVSEITQSTLPLTSNNIYSEIQNDLMRPIFTSSLMAHNSFVKDWSLKGEKEADSMTRYLAEIQEKYNAITTFYVSDSTHNYYHPSGLLRKVSEDNKGDKWFFDVKRLTDDFEINIDYDTATPSRLTVFINFKVLDSNGQLLGVTGLGLSLEEVQKLIDEYQNTYNRLIYFFDESGQLTLRGKSYTRLGKTFAQKEFKQLIKNDYAKTQQLSFQYQSQDNIVYVNLRYIPEFHWYVAIEQVSGKNEKLLLNSLIVNLAISIIISIFVLSLSYLTIARYQRRLEKMASVDKLSGALNRHSFELAFNQNALLVERNKTHFSGILLDIDFFKKVNDQHGHITGDIIIREVADLVRSQLRASDLLFRWGGEEFLLLLPECDLTSAEKLAEKIRLAFTTNKFSHNEPLTASFGVAQYKDSEFAWIHQMDTALYKAKASGRNKVVVGTARA